MNDLKSYGVSVTGVWIQDWEGIRMTSFGQRLMWNWAHDPKRYPDFKENVRKLKEEGIRFLAYSNCYLAIDGALFKEAKDLGYLAKNDKGEIYEVDFGEFYCGIPDFTREEVCKWFAKRILVEEMLDYGIEGWMADFGEYLPIDVKLSESVAMKKHNEWPVLWAKVNDMALGGYTSLFGNVRTPELNDRWIEFAAFTSTMRSHETNRPNDNVQLYDSPTSMVLLSKMVRIFKALKEYRINFMKDAKDKGISLMRPLFFEYENDKESYSIDYEYMLGSDILVAPVWKEKTDNWEVYLPNDKWVHLWSDKEYDGGQTITIESGVGNIPVFIKKSSKYLDLFRSLKSL